MLWGDAGDIEVEFRHPKQPGEPVEPLLVTHDHSRGFSTAVPRDAEHVPDDRPDEIPSWALERVSSAVAASEGPVNKAWVEKNVGGDNNVLRRAFQTLIDDGYLERAPGPRKGDYYVSAARWIPAETPLASGNKSPLPAAPLEGAQRAADFSRAGGAYLGSSDEPELDIDAVIDGVRE